MEKVLKLSDNKVMVFYHIPLILKKYDGWFKNQTNEETIVLGYHKLKLRYNISNLDNIHEYGLKKKFRDLIKNKFDLNEFKLEYAEEYSNIPTENGYMKIKEPVSISLYINKINWDDYVQKHVVDNRNNSIDILLD
jgi:hypothetical protein